MIVVTSVFKRPSESVLWYTDYLEANNDYQYLNYISENFIDTGEMTVTKTLSEDKLTQTAVRIFTKSGFDKWFVDSEILKARTSWHEYCDRNNITIEKLDMSEM